MNVLTLLEEGKKRTYKCFYKYLGKCFQYQLQACTLLRRAHTVLCSLHNLRIHQMNYKQTKAK